MENDSSFFNPRKRPRSSSEVHPENENLKDLLKKLEAMKKWFAFQYFTKEDIKNYQKIENGISDVNRLLKNKI